MRAEDGDVVGGVDGDGRGDGDVDVAVVGAGPTGLALALQLAAFGVRCRLLDAGPEPAPHSRAMAIQPRTLEVLRPLGVSEDLVRRGNVGARLHVHAGGRVTTTKLFDTGLPDTAYPHLLFLSQAETERALLDALARRGAGVERSTRLVGLDDEGARVVCRTRHADGTTRSWRARYVVGCDGAASAVRRLSGIPFVGGAYPQTFVLADLGVDGLEPLDGSDGRSPAPEPSDVHAYITPWGPLLFFPLRRPAPRRLIAARPTAAAAAAGSARGPADVDLAELQSICDRATGAALRLRDPVWLSAFTIHHRMAGTYARGRVLLAGDAAHVHSPVGAQGMNTGIQDAVNLGWKLALVVRGDAGEALLRTYDTERRPVGAFVVRTTDRAFVVATSAHPVATAVRTRVLPRLLPALVRWPLLRRTGFRAMSQLSIRYGGSCAVHPSGRSHRRRARRRGLQAGDRLPDGPVVRNGPVDGMTGRLHDVLAAPAFHLLLCGPADRWDSASVDALATRFAGLLHVHRVDRSPGPGVLHDPHGTLLRHLSAGRPTQLLVRPDGHVGLRAEHVDLSATAAYLRGLAAPGPAAGQRPDGAG